MKLTIMSSLCGKSLVFSVLVSLFAIYSSNASAQNKFFAPDSTAKSPTKTSKNLPETSAAVNLNSIRIYEVNSKDEKIVVETESKNEQREAKIERFNTFYEVKNETAAGEFQFESKGEGSINSVHLTSRDKEKNRFRQIIGTKDQADDPDNNPPLENDFQWRSAVKQSLMFLGVQHGYAILGQAKTRRALKHGPFFKDYIDSVKSLHGWSDGGRFFTNYIAHPMQGSLTGFIFVQNDPKGRKAEFGSSEDYWKSRMKAMAWTAAWSTQFEIGPISQASIGNVGLKGKQTWEDIVTTPTLGTAMLITEDALDRFIIKKIERRTDNFYIKVFTRMLFNPTRNFSNMLRFKAPWHRDRPPSR